jgi:hypothetical protein
MEKLSKDGRAIGKRAGNGKKPIFDRAMTSTERGRRRRERLRKDLANAAQPA